ncbi:aminotransferase class III-fold pyridoxal phosphate-dependent enzyme [Croceitalea sp. MTPC5]|uniref:aminotransferase class III-fold pyridoxal phosphate-dependent enzyme n=1 Tax=Croceitalea sp. MTPC5 TaxID=3056565 RepID=UPI0030CBBAC5
MFLPEKWPSYYEKAEGCTVWDLDGNKYTDVCIMGIGTNILGYANKEVDNAVREVIDKSNMSTFNAPEEVYLAERLIELHPWADMARFARSGGEANAIAIRIARAASGKDKVAICGYHGWHDWYISTNLGSDDGLGNHLLPGLAPAGVPKGLEGTTIPFQYNDFEELERIVLENKDLGTVKMEVSRNFGPENGFLQKVRELCTKHGIVLIFDECTSGFRQTFGGLHKAYGVEPDLCMFGKALGNGYAVTGVLGRQSIMQAAQNTFISSTFWTERIGSVAALKTLEVMEKSRSWEQITKTGNQISDSWQRMAQSHGLSLQISGLPALISFSFKSDAHLAYKTYITQEMLKKGFIAATSVYVSIAHTQAVITDYFDALDDIFVTIAKCERQELNILDLLESPICHGGFKRLN